MHYDNMRAAPQGTENPVQGKRSQNDGAKRFRIGLRTVCARGTCRSTSNLSLRGSGNLLGVITSMLRAKACEETRSSRVNSKHKGSEP